MSVFMETSFEDDSSADHLGTRFWGETTDEHVYIYTHILER